MQNTTESPTTPAGGPPPPPPPPPNQVNQAPMLPRVVAAVPSPAAAATVNPFATSMNPAPASAPTYKQHRGGGVRRFVSWMLVLVVLGGLTAAGIIYGPELMDRATNDDGLDEPDAALVFPTAAEALPPMRTVTYTVEQVDAAGDTHTYSATNDFESGVAKVTLERVGLPDIEVLSVFDVSLIRRVDEPTWYRMQRGDFPVGSSRGRERFVRTLDEVLPPSIRSSVTIERSTESVIANQPARHLLVSVEPSLLASLTSTVAPPVPAPVDPAAAQVDPAALPAAPVAPQTAPVVSLPPGMELRPGVDRSVPLEIEMWIDDTGLVRKVVLPAELGGETVTVTNVSGDPFEASFPTEDAIMPLTANALLHLGL